MAIIEINDLSNIELKTSQVNNDLCMDLDKQEMASIVGGYTCDAPIIGPIIIIGSNNKVEINFSYFNYNNQIGANFFQSASSLNAYQSNLLFGTI